MGEMKICRHCGNDIPANAKKCKFCKAELDIPDTPDMYCKKCGSPVSEEDNFCQHCGAIFNIPDYIKPAEHNASGIRYNIGILLTSIASSIAITVFYSSGKDISIGESLICFSIALIATEIIFYIYFLPSILAIENNNPNAYFIYVCNLIFGATIIGWIISLIFAIRSEE